MWRGRMGRSSNGGYKGKQFLRYYFTHNIHITTSGNFSTPTLIHAMTEIGADRIMYSIDYPYEDAEEATEWWESVTISPSDKAKIGRQNAIKLFKLPLEMEVPENDKPYFKGGGTGPVEKWQI
jgi:predicted TIM-barrel fold metal-dependent hydrolase